MKCIRFSWLIVTLAVSIAMATALSQAADTKEAAKSAAVAKPADAKTEGVKADDTKADEPKAKSGKVKPKRQPKSKEPKAPSAATPSEKVNDKGWQARHKAICDRIKQGNVDLIFIGDSITQGWAGRGGKEVWEKYYAKRNAANLGIGGDRTQHVLWRLDNGAIEGITPKLAVIMIGTNNSSQNSPEDIAAGVKAIVERLRAKLPGTNVLLLGIFPRGADATNTQRQTNVKTNAIIAKLADDKSVYYLDISEKFLEKDGTLSKEMMPDLLHLNAKSYTIWAEAIEPMVVKLMAEKTEKAAEK